jgi:hypothetical protein
MRNAISLILLFGLCFAQESQQTQNRTRVQISSATVDNPTLTCSGVGRQATVSVQVWIIPTPQRPTGESLTVGLYEADSKPLGNRLVQDEVRKKVEVGESPAVLAFKLQCGPDTTPGEIRFTANIDSAPAGFEVVRPDPPEDGMVKLHIK